MLIDRETDRQGVHSPSKAINAEGVLTSFLSSLRGFRTSDLPVRTTWDFSVVYERNFGRMPFMTVPLTHTGVYVTVKL